MRKRKFRKQEVLSVAEFREKYAGSIAEEDVQSSIIAYCQARKHLVLQTSHRSLRFPCPHCKQDVRSPKGYGATPGVPDLLVRKTDWPPYFWLGIEVKGAKTAISEEQKALQALGAIVVVRSLDEAIQFIDAVVFPPHPPFL